MSIRKLTVLDINDKEVKEFQTGVGRATHFEVRRLRTWKDVQRDIGGHAPFRPDIVLTDIDFEDDPGIGALGDEDFPGCGRAKPIGPMLALPYVSSRAVWTYVVYSAHFRQRASSGVMTSPWVLLPLGVLLAKGQGKTFGSSSLEGPTEDENYLTIEKHLEGSPWLAIGDNASALEEALEVYTGRLTEAIASGQIRVTNSEWLWQYLEGLVEQFEQEGIDRVPVDADAHLEIRSDSFGVDRIQWLSLCADLVGWSAAHVDRDSAEDMLNFARMLFGREGGEVLQHSGTIDDAFNKTLSVFRFQDMEVDMADKCDSRAGEDVIWRKPFHEALTELYGNELHDMRREILRIGALLANAYACARSRFESCEWRDIADRLGYSPEANQYRRYFGGSGNNPKVYPRSVNVDKLDLFFNPEGESWSDRLEWGKSELSKQDKQRIKDFLELFQDDGESVHYHLPASLPYLD